MSRKFWLFFLLFWVLGATQCQCEPSAREPSPKPVTSPKVAKPSESIKPAMVEAVKGLPAPMVRPKGFARGVSLGLFVSERDPAARRFYYEQLLDEIKELGATDVSLVVRWAQDDIRASSVERDAVTAPDEVLVEVMEMCEARSLRVFLLPILHLRQRKRGEWRGKLKPADEEAWWSSYGAMITHYARLSQAHKVSLLAVGSELVSMERHQNRWRALIKDVRRVYEGRLTYSANWDHFEPVQFWDALDVVGVTAYQELSKADDPDEESLVKGWSAFTRRLRPWAKRHGHKVLITEVGFPSHTQGVARPWDYTPRGEVDLALQLRAFRATYRVWNEDPLLEGLFVWNWFGVGGPGDRGYTPRGKPAAHVLHHWYRRD